MKKKTINLYALPSTILPENADVVDGQATMPSNILPVVIHRSDGNVSDKIAVLSEWFLDSLYVDNGYLVASAALPALSLNRAAWNEVVLPALGSFLAAYDIVRGPVFLPENGLTRSGKFAVADWYSGMLVNYGAAKIATYTNIADTDVVVIEESEVGDVADILELEPEVSEES